MMGIIVCRRWGFQCYREGYSNRKSLRQCASATSSLSIEGMCVRFTAVLIAAHCFLSTMLMIQGLVFCFLSRFHDIGAPAPAVGFDPAIKQEYWTILHASCWLPPSH